MKQEYRPLQEQTVINMLLSLRSQISRDSLDGLEEVEKLLVLRGVDRQPTTYLVKLPSTLSDMNCAIW